MRSIFSKNNLKNKFPLLFGILFVVTLFATPTIARADVLLPGGINTCGELAAPGIYTLTSDVSNGASTCFTISSDNVIIDGWGFTVSGTGAVAIDGRVYSGGSLVNGADSYTNIIINDLNISGYTAGINFSGNSDATGLGVGNGFGGNGGNIATYNSNTGSIIVDGGNSSSQVYGGEGGNISLNGINLDISNATLSALGGTGTVGKYFDGGLDLNYTGTLTKTNVVLSSFSFFNDNTTEFGIYVGGTWPLLPGTISTCGTLYGSGTFTLSQSISGISGTCFTIGSNDILLDGAGYTISPSISTTTSYAINAGAYSNFTLASTTVTNFSNVITSSSSVTVSGDTLSLSNKKITASSTVINAGTFNTASSTYITNTLEINYSVSITGTSTASSSALSNLRINDLDYGAKSSGLLFANVWFNGTSIQYFRSIASSADGTKLVTVAQGGYIYTSADSGVTWTQRTSAGIDWSFVASDASGDKLVATHNNAANIYTSIDGGSTWVSRDSTRSWVGVTSSADGVKLAAITSSSGFIYTSTDSGVTWNNATANTPVSWNSISSSADGSKLIASGGNLIYLSTDSGATWATSTNAGSKAWGSVDSSADGTKLVAAVSSVGYIYTSTNGGSTWATSSTAVGVKSWTSVTSSADGTTLVGTVSGNYIYKSTDSGATWVQQTSAGSKDWRSAALSADGSKVAAVSYGNGTYTQTSFTPNFSVDILLPQTGNTISSWNPKVSWGVSRYCYYSYDNFVSTSTANCSLAGSDIAPPSSTGSVTLYVKGVSNLGGTILNRDVTFNNYTNPTISISSPVSNTTYDASTWRPSVDYSISNANLVSCQYSYDNFVSTSTANCSLAGSDIAPPSDGTKTLYIKTIDIDSNVNTLSVSFLYTSHWDEKTSVGSRAWQSIASSYDGTKVVAVVSGGQIYTSTSSGATWTARDSSRDWRSVTSSTDGTKLAATTYGGQIYTSIDSGVTWTPRGLSRYWWRIASSADGSKLFAAVHSSPSIGYIYTSADSGVTWATSTGSVSLGGKYWSSIASDESGTKIVASVGAPGSTAGYIYTSSDSGVTWATTTAPSKQWTAVTSSSDGTKLAASAYTGQLYTSTDSGVTWIARDSVRDWYSISSSADGGKLYAAVGYNGQIYVSVNGGVTWTPTESNRYWSTVNVSGNGNKIFAAVGIGSNGYLYVLDTTVSETYVNNYMSIVSPVLNTIYTSLNWAPSLNWGFNKSTCNYSYNNFVSTSTANCSLAGSDITPPSSDGANTLYVKSFDASSNMSSSSVAFSYYSTGWTPRESNRSWTSIASSADGTKLIASVSSPGSTVGYLYTSTDAGVTWIQRTSAGQRYWMRVSSSFDGMKLTAVTYGQYVYNSTDGGVTWTQRTSFGTKNSLGIASSADGTKLALAVYSNYIYTSSDSGATWATSTIALGTKAWNAIASSADGTNLAAVAGYVGTLSHIYTSSDSGATWATSTIALGTKAWSSITSSADGTKLAAVVQGGQIYTSTSSGATWTARDSSRQWYSITSSADGTKLAAVVQGGQIYTSTDSGVTWVLQTSSKSTFWISITSSADGTKLAAVVSSGQVYTHADSPRALSVDIILPQSVVDGSWTPIVSWGTATSCYYSYDNFASTSTVDCALNGSDISAPSTSGSNTLYVRGIDAGAVVKTSSKTFTFSPYYWCGTADSNWSNTSNWYTNSSCTVNIGSLPATTSAVFLVGATSPIISTATTTIPTLINSTGLTGGANTAGVIFSGATINTANIIGNVTFNNPAYNTGVITGNAIFANASAGTHTLTGTMKWDGTISGTIKGGDAVDITHLIFNDSSSNETTIPSNFSTVFNNSASNNGIINGDAAFNNTGLFTMGTVNGTSTLSGVSQALNGVNNVINLVKRVATAIHDTFYLTSGSILNVSGIATLTGYDANNLLSIKTTTPGGYAVLNIIGTAVMDFFKIRDIHNTSPSVDFSNKTIFDDGGNSGFTFKSGTSLSERGGMTSEYLSGGDPVLPGTISACGTLYFPGTYTLSENITNASGTPCFVVKANGVTIDGAGYTVTATGVNSNYAVITQGIESDGGSAFGTTTIEDISFTGFAGGIDARGNSATTNGTSGGNGGAVIVSNSTMGSIDVSGATGLGAGIHGSGATVSVSNSVTGNITSAGTNGTIIISDTNPNLSNNTYTASSTLSLVYAGTLTTTSTTLSALEHLINNGVDLGSFSGGSFPILPGTITACGNLSFSGTYTFATNIVGNCNILKEGVIISGDSNILTGNVTANTYGVTLSGINITGSVSTVGIVVGAVNILNASNLSGTVSVTGAITGDGSSSLGNTTISSGGSVATSSVSFVGDVVNNGTINSGNSVVGKITNTGIINGDFTFNASSTNSGIVNGNVVLNASSTNTGTVNGTQKFNTLTAVDGVVSFSGTSIFGGTGYVTSNIYDSTNSLINKWVFNASSTNTGYLKGAAEFRDTSSSAGTITGNVDIYFPVARPLSAVISGRITYYGYPGLYFNDTAVGHGVVGKWDDANNWWADDSFTIPAGVVPSSGDDVTIYGNITNASTTAYTKTIVFQSTSNNDIEINVSGTSTDAALFNATSSNSGSIVGNATFSDSSTNSGTISGYITRQYNAGIYVVLDDFTHNGLHWLIQAINGASVDLTNATYSLVDNAFQALNNGVFIFKNLFVGAPEVVVSSPVFGTNIKWNPNVSWGTNNLCQYKIDGGAYTSVDCSLDGADIPRPTAGAHTMYFKSTDSKISPASDITEKIVSFTYDNTQPIDTDCSSPLDEDTRPYYYLIGDVAGDCTVTASSTLRGNDNIGNYYSIDGNVIGSGSDLRLENITINGTTSGSADINVSSSTINGLTSVSGSLLGDQLTTFATTTINSGAILYGGYFTQDLTNNGTIESSSSTPTTVLGSTINNSIINGDFTFNSSSINTGTVNGDATMKDSSRNTGTVTGDLILDTFTSSNGRFTFTGSQNFLGTGQVDGDVRDHNNDLITVWVFTDSSTNSGYTKGSAYFNNSSSNTGTITGDADVYYGVTVPLMGTVNGTTSYHSYVNAKAFSNISGDGMWNNPLNWFTDTTLVVPLNAVPLQNEDVILFASTTLSSNVTNNIYVASNNIQINGGGHTMTGNISGNGAYGGFDAFSFDLLNITVMGTTTAVGGDGIPLVSHGGKGGTININTSSTGLISVNGGDPELQNGGDAGTITVINSFAIVEGTQILAVGGASVGCGFGGSGGDISLIDSSGYVPVVATGADANSTCVVIPPAPTNRTGGRTSVVGRYSAPSVSPSNNPAPTPKTSGGSVRKIVQDVIKKIFIPVQMLKPLEFKTLPKFGTNEKGSFSFLTPLKNFLFAPAIVSLGDKLNSVPNLESYLKTIGISTSQNLADLQRNPIILAESSKEIEGIWYVYTKGIPVKNSEGEFIATNIPIKTKLAGNKKDIIYQTLEILPKTKFTISVLGDTNTTVRFRDTDIPLEKDGTRLVASITSPASAGIYTVTSKASPLSLTIEVKDTMQNTNYTKVLNLWGKIKSWFGNIF